MIVKKRRSKVFKNIARMVGLLPLVQRIRNKMTAGKHIKMLNETKIFHTASPNLLIGIFDAFCHLKKNNPHLLENGSYLEFGLFKGFALWFSERISKEFTKDFMHYGFDSFAGLPKSIVDQDEPYWAPGAYACSQEQVVEDIKFACGDLSRIRLTKGWFSKKLFADIIQDKLVQKPAIVVIDSDVYESCQIILEEFGPLFQKGTIVLFDDFNGFDKSNDHGERRALKEFQENHPNFKIVPLFGFGWHGEAFEVQHEV